MGRRRSDHRRQRGYPGRDDADRRRQHGLLERRRANAIPSLYAKGAVIRSIGAGETYAGVDAIRALADGSFTVERVAPVTVDGEYATSFMRLSAPGYGTAKSVSVFQMKDGQIVRQWNFVPGQTPPFDNAVLP